MYVPRVELREEERGLYVLDAEMSPMLVGTARPPIAPASCIPDPEPEINERGAAFLVRYVLDCRERPLGAGDEIELPWNLDGIQLTVRFVDGEERRGLFGREAAGGIVIRFDLILPRRDDPAQLTLTHFSLGLRHFLTGWAHLLLVIGLGLLLPFKRLAPALAGLAGGHALSLVLAELSVIGLPTGPAEASVAAAVVIFAALALRERQSLAALVFAAALLGVIHGLGIATRLSGEGLAGGSLLVALFSTNLAIDLAGFALGLIVSTVATFIGENLRNQGTVIARIAGVVGAFLMFFTLAAAIRPSGQLTEAEDAYLAVGSAAATSGPSGVPTQLTSTGQLARPFMSYLIVEPFQVRLEVLTAVQSLDAWLDLPSDVSGVIPAEAGGALGRQVAELLGSETHLLIDGTPATATERRADFVVVGTTGVLTRETPVPETVADAILGVTLLYETEGIPESVSVEWGLFTDDEPLPITATDPAATLESELSIAQPTHEWRNTLGEYSLPSVESIATGKPRLPVASLLLAFIAAVVIFATRKSEKRSRGRRLALACLVVGYLLYPFARVSAEIPLVSQARLSKDQAADVLERLLTNVYRSFDIHSEEAIYDRLALTVTGDQLLEVYLESRQALELENRGGARVRIEEVVVREVRSVRRTSESGYAIDLVWTVGGSVNHFGHQHFRQNWYDAVIRVVPVEGVWKIESVDVAEEKRLL
jgi:hypothetical protein